MLTIALIINILLLKILFIKLNLYFILHIFTIIHDIMIANLNKIISIILFPIILLPIFLLVSLLWLYLRHKDLLTLFFFHKKNLNCYYYLLNYYYYLFNHFYFRFILLVFKFFVIKMIAQISLRLP